MVFIHIEKHGAMNVHRMEMLKTVKTVIQDVVEEFGQPLDIVERNGTTRLMYGGVDGVEWLVYVNEVKRLKWKG